MVRSRCWRMYCFCMTRNHSVFTQMCAVSGTPATIRMEMECVERTNKPTRASSDQIVFVPVGSPRETFRAYAVGALQNNFLLRSQSYRWGKSLARLQYFLECNSLAPSLSENSKVISSADNARSKKARSSIQPM